ncbi:7TM diverse intracellular signaling domain-containing protein [Hymenobacter sp. M29]|uniref:7TM diverse intracellular signaling domain-containing protein n=1 Tax=Hymenobacter mellowenesis TaxID=3063995 RepID=A0ABT9A4Z7_9BACT|nr:7TM diverse intracellular signaling domain-containing protein [Hymenobacter sp. M29]MDO7844921.1 7TM diverse intracellular signaling domain-containing protein [Hymenobacter sp. M29]
MRFCLFVVLMLWAAGTAWAEAPHLLRDTLLLKDPEGPHLSEAYRYYTEPFGIAPGPEQAEAQWRAGRFRPGPWHKTLNLGLLHQRVWLRLPVRNTEARRLRFVWGIFNFADSAALYCRRPGETTYTRIGAASSWVSAADRQFPARSLSFPFELDAGEAAVLLLRIDVHTGGVYLPTYIETTEHFLAWEMGFPFERHWVWLLGFYLSSALFNLVLFAFLRDRIHLWYVAYVVAVTLFLMMEDGLDAMLLPTWLYQLLWSVGQYNFMILAGAAGIRIMLLFLRLPKRRRLYRAGTWLAGGAVGLVAGYAVLFPWAVRHSLPLVEALNFGREMLMVLVFGYGWVTLITAFLTRHRRRLAAYYALTYLFFFVGYGIFWLNHLGLSSFNPIYPNTLAWGLFAELLVLSALLTGRFRHTLRQNAQLRIRRLQQRNDEGARLIAAQDAEREQLARELHDALGPNLAALHMAWQSNAVRDALAAAPNAATIGLLTEEILGQLYGQVRQLSHALLPTAPGTNRLSTSVAALCDAFNLNGTPHVATQFDGDLDHLPSAVQSAAYRIVAELLNNAVRHAQAQHVQVQLRRRLAALEICVQDDGRGFGRGEDSPTTGIGLRGVRTRAAYLSGSVRIETPEVGTRVVVSLPC